MSIFTLNIAESVGLYTLITHIEQCLGATVHAVRDRKGVKDTQAVKHKHCVETGTNMMAILGSHYGAGYSGMMKQSM